ncbi:MAG TPA: hypothetical protein VGP64_06285 [Polyangia bacterium]|jgi:hypothetical protein
MMRTFGLAFGLAFGVCLPAPAQTADSRGQQPRGALYAVAGIGTPVGFFGLEGLYRVVANVEVAVGAGLGLSSQDTAQNNQLHVLQWAVMPRYRVGAGLNALVIGLGLSGGNYSHSRVSLCGSQEEELECITPQSWRYTLWSNLEIGGEYWAASRVAFRYFAGYGHILGQGARQCVPAPQGCQDESNIPYANIPYFGIAVGGWF